MIILLYTSMLWITEKKLETCTGSTVQKISVVLTANLSNIKCVTVTKHKTIAIHMCVVATKIQNGWPVKKIAFFELILTLISG